MRERNLPRNIQPETHPDDERGRGREGSRLHRMDRFEAECIGTRLLLANALLRDCWASNNLADRGRALAAARRAKDIFSAGGDPGG